MNFLEHYEVRRFMMPDYNGHGSAIGVEVRLEIHKSFIYPELIHGYCGYYHPFSS
jgi:hypothetical protein